MKSPLLKLILINLGVTAGLLFTLNFLANLVQLVGAQVIDIMGWEGGVEEVVEDQNLAELPNYQGRRDEMYRHFRETLRIPVVYEPSVGWTREPFEGKTITIDAQGNRVHQPLPASAQTSKPKVYIFGGSTVWGTGATDNETLPAFYQKFSDLPTVNKGETGYISRQSLASFVNLLSTKEPMDAVIFYEGVNDVQYSCRAELKVNEHGRTAVFRSRLRQKKSSRSEAEDFKDYLNALFLGGIQDLGVDIVDSINDARPTKRKDDSMICDNDPERARQVAETLLSNWEIAHALAQTRGIQFLAVLQPVAYMGQPKLDHINDDLDDQFGKQYQAVYPILQQLIRERNYDWIVDYTDLLSRDEYIYIDFCHVSPNGNEILARRLVQDTRSRWMRNEAAPSGRS
ncbi:MULTISPECIES: hypothetical protein [unclassified Leptolyngbya]|uniref:SGNH/GDSL hydrolase family protein n=1 Tax=unclassified Leptolyngbya TaxID=2650499 RepID=UPI001684776A|nr:MULTISPECIES: hypothetical protein [unclassified Leptolyngbya]MBD1911790.1 hypothetical protein [Leptolyngbya sp. FACHB-8]MBD2153320.1 hypothetical protein [Leptolyngbya sp. FACHB-16]